MDAYLNMIGLKTGVLLACSAQMGAILAGADHDSCEALYNYGYQLGIAFQIADDYLDAFGDEQVFGKPIGGDILNCKKSWLTVRALQKSQDKPSFLKAFAAPAETDEQKGAKIASVKNIYVELGVDTDATREIQRYSDLAMEAVASLKLGSVRKETLRRFAENLVGRAK